MTTEINLHETYEVELVLTYATVQRVSSECLPPAIDVVGAIKELRAISRACAPLESLGQGTIGLKDAKQCVEQLRDLGEQSLPPASRTPLTLRVPARFVAGIHTRCVDLEHFEVVGIYPVPDRVRLFLDLTGAH